MKHFTSFDDVQSVDELLNLAFFLQQNPQRFSDLGKGKTLGLVFLNPSLRTRISTQKAASGLGLNTMVFNLNKEGWELETADGIIMNGTTVEHIKDAAKVLGLYCDIIGVRSFAKLADKEKDYAEEILNGFIQYSNVPVINLESALLHPLQSLADLLTIKEHCKNLLKPKVVLMWAPHVKPLPQAVANSFAQWMNGAQFDLHIACPSGYKLDKCFTESAPVYHNQNEALAGADFVYLKNWSSFDQYGSMPRVEDDWLLTPEKLSVTNHAKIMHCLPVRRNLEVSDAVLDSPQSLIYNQAANRVWAAQAVLKSLLDLK